MGVFYSWQFVNAIVAGGGVFLNWTAPTLDEESGAMAPTSYLVQAGAYDGDTLVEQNVGNVLTTNLVASPMFLTSGTWYCRVIAINNPGVSVQSLPPLLPDVIKVIP